MEVIKQKVKKIIEDVRKNCDRAVRRYTEIFDKEKLRDFSVSRKEIKEAYKKTSRETIKALESAAINIRRFAELQLKNFKSFEYENDGIILGQKVIPIERVGVYVPGGRYPLLSTALMGVIPAKAAGVKEIIVCSPKIKSTTIVAADLAGADLIFRIGGVQAIAAMAFGTETIPKVDKIVGPGNIYVTLAKKEVFGEVGIDFLAGPTEILLIVDEYANPRFAAADLLAQAEHDLEAKIFLVSSSRSFLEKVRKELKTQLKNLATKEIIKEVLRNKKEILVKDLDKAVVIANEIAPEHLALQVKNPRKYLGKLRNYGSLFLGCYSSVAFGDYCSGTNHILPTGAGARYSGGLSVRDFLKISAYQFINKKAAKKLARVADELATAEGLEAHKKSAELRA